MLLVAWVSFLTGLLLFVCAVVCSIFPSAIENKKTGAVPNSGEVLLGGILALMIGVGLAAFVVPERKAAAKAVVDQSSEAALVADAASAVSTSAAQAAPYASFGITPNQFRTEYNRRASSDYELAELKIGRDHGYEGYAGYDGFKQVVGPNVGITGRVNEVDGSLAELIANVAPNESGMTVKYFAVLGAMAAALDPAMSSPENLEKLTGIILRALEQRKEHKVFEHAIGKLRYSASASETTGLWLVINPR
ncbi:hypothetical protein WJ32_24545 [Burkholderia ubonensis]|uniref:Uncharacterized protein n=1 Tax=Burkholderia ubonensis TaxID=101571 RepID=A0A103QZ37_9BURK|nr:hypothetical protein [Burkholderia ubonensis]AOJ65624.1 hypothetical protein WJ32_24545 [Burkholderia ubonensis]KVG58198.1 hypothetical protein WJ33_34670 [Burkholderia ubonensis]